MKSYIAAAALLAVGLVGHAYLSTPRFEIVKVGDDHVFRLNRWDGAIAICGVWQDESVSCGQVHEAGYLSATSPNSN